MGVGVGMNTHVNTTRMHTSMMMAMLMLAVLVSSSHGISETEQAPVCVADTGRNDTANGLAIELEYEALTSVTDFDAPFSAIAHRGEANATKVLPVHGAEYDDMQALGKAGDVFLEPEDDKIDVDVDGEAESGEEFGEDGDGYDVEDGFDENVNYEEGGAFFEPHDEDSWELNKLLDEGDDEIGAEDGYEDEVYLDDGVDDGSLGLEDDEEGLEDDGFELDGDGDEGGFDEFGNVGDGDYEEDDFEAPVSMRHTAWNGLASEAYNGHNGTLYADEEWDLEE